ncbi:hypothetical protein B0T16DRAFT_457082 [Cercophora newfieldiana]|uniref:Protein kinase domain-containing protein n=1 Tax=Cercophora newfieldiana TaxID=92897 RepID=A0AA39YDV6_9PEZI|nr:hypothetical protein B0T16DRAFT_457082 [Cercophora newfieldiana]
MAYSTSLEPTLTSESRFAGFPISPATLSPGPPKETEFCFPLYDGDSRRWIGVQVTDIDAAAWKEWNDPKKNQAIEDGILKSIAEKLDNGVPLTFVVVKPDGTIASTSTSPKKDVTPGTYYAPPAAYQLPGIETISRDSLVEIGRIAPYVDVVLHISDPYENLVFKHYESGRDISSIWNTIQVAARLNSPHIIPIRHLVVNEGPSGGIVGYTTPFITGGSLAENRNTRTFKLKYARQLFALIDDLTLGHGIIPKSLRNTSHLMVDPTTDNLVLTNLGSELIVLSQGDTSGDATSPHTTELNEFAHLYEDDDNAPTSHTKSSLPPISIPIASAACAAISLVHDLVTRSPSPSHPPTIRKLWTLEDIQADSAWTTTTPGISLDHPVSAFRDATLAWIRQRGTTTSHSDIKSKIDFPGSMPLPEAETVPVKGKYWDPLTGMVREDGDVKVSGWEYYKRDAQRAEREIVEWGRPVAGRVEGGRPLLASGRYKEEGEKRGRGRGRGGRKGSKGRSGKGEVQGEEGKGKGKDKGKGKGKDKGRGGVKKREGRGGK